ncbi:hydroxymethylglutaryl-CoA lyase [Sulfitobacter pacificus]|uniref:Hydroxymethylglutaryl-CoA lyase n=1 Tax=Sulfitobacter pacificus TaxID=1499314 RepID=A0ABQ5VPX1_9RHOB|nr:hydroxymethylglutaryl-CoA lyase [Sulfitobacter pacificus]GLQ29205.1 hydroxymethylglutaryl-CoA lyase [Sulfitobacter pacificus]
MSFDLPKRVEIFEEGPREGFQIESAQIPTSEKVRFINALSQTGVKHIQCVSFVNPKRVPGMTDAEEVARLITKVEGVSFTGIWLNYQGLERAAKSSINLCGELQMYASQTFGIKNSNRDDQQMIAEQRRYLEFYGDNNIPLDSAILMTAFGCNYEGAIPIERVLAQIASILALAEEYGLQVPRLRLADTVGLAVPTTIIEVVSAVREKWPDLRLGLHLHDTRGSGLANCFAGLSLGIDSFDTACGGLGGCPFAGHRGAAGNVCTEDLVFMCHEMGIDTGIDLEKMIECARMAEQIVGHPLPSKLVRAAYDLPPKFGH